MIHLPSFRCIIKGYLDFNAAYVNLTGDTFKINSRMYNEFEGFNYIFKKLKNFFKKFIKTNSLYIQIVFRYFITLYRSFNVSFVTLTRYTFNSSYIQKNKKIF